MGTRWTPSPDHDIPRAVWPVEVQRLHPVAVYDYEYDVVIVLWSDAHEEEGYYIVPPSVAAARSTFHSLPDGSEWSFKPLNCPTGDWKGDGWDDMIGKWIYECHRKKR
jgi:hypothetical protein